jgi:site-specific DNA recombinase
MVVFLIFAGEQGGDQFSDKGPQLLLPGLKILSTRQRNVVAVLGIIRQVIIIYSFITDSFICWCLRHHPPWRLRHHPYGAAAVKKAYADVLAGVSVYSIAQDWNAQGFTSARGRAWTQTGVRAVLLNPRNAGLRAHKGVIVGKAVWPAIVDRDTFDGMVALLTSSGRRVGGARGRKYLLSGLAVCGKCGKTLGSAMPSKRGQEPRYHCKHCHGVARKIESVDNFVLDVVAERLSRNDAADLLVKRNAPDLAALRARATALREQQDAMAVAHSNQQVTLSQLIAFNESVNAQLAEIKAQTEDDGKARILKDVIGGDVRRKLDGYDLDRQRAIIDVLLTVTVLPGQARGKLRTELLPITWKGAPG